MIGKILTGIYIAGYFLYIIVAAIWAWHTPMSLYQWWRYVGYQTLFATVWPIQVVIELLG